jgi:threonine dehydrogenase-like Zn-dependent dehydrogenase
MPIYRYPWASLGMCGTRRERGLAVAAAGKLSIPSPVVLTIQGDVSMRAAIFRGGEIVADTMAEPVPAKGQVLVKTLACGICGSDLHARKHAHRMVEMSKYLAGNRKPMDLSRDVVFGHEFCCEVLDYGPGSERKLKPGTRVCSVPGLISPSGPQVIGYSNENIGGYAERMLLSEALLLEVPNGLAAEHAALTEPLAVGIHAVEKANVRGDEVPLVIGCGPVGLAVIAGLKLKGLRPIVAADYSPTRRELAEKLGADIVIDPATTQPFGSWAEHARMTSEESAARPPWQAFLPALKPALIFECVGVPGVIQQLFEGAPRDARIVVVGVCMESDRNEPMLGIVKELNLQYVLGYTPVEFGYSLRLIADGQVDAASLITAKVGIDGVAKAFDDLGNPEQLTKIIVEPWR